MKWFSISSEHAFPLLLFLTNFEMGRSNEEEEGKEEQEIEQEQQQSGFSFEICGGHKSA